MNENPSQDQSRTSLKVLSAFLFIFYVKNCSKWQMLAYAKIKISRCRWNSSLAVIREQFITSS